MTGWLVPRFEANSKGLACHKRFRSRLRRAKFNVRLATSDWIIVASNLDHCALLASIGYDSTEYWGTR